jgi:hypothetical protein
MLGLGLGSYIRIASGLIYFPASIFSKYRERVIAAGGVVENDACALVFLNNIGEDTYNSASLIMYPSGYKVGTIFDLKPTDGTGDLTFTRASTATRVNAAGLVEIPKTNLFLQSQTFENASWIKAFATITANATTAPDGTLTADKLVEDATTNVHYIEQVPTLAASTTYVCTIYGKAAERSSLYIWLADAGWNTMNAGAIFNLSTGTITVSVGAVAATITNVGNGWYKCTVGDLTAASGTRRIRITPAIGGNANYAGNGTSGLFIWGAQLEQGVTSTEYIPTVASIRTKFAGITQDGGSASNIARIDFTGGGCGKSLLEPQRTNSILYSEQFDNAAWTAVDSTITTNAAVSPSGATNAETMTISGSTSRVTQGIALGAGTYKVSAYVKVISQTTAGTLRLVGVVDGSNSNVNFTPTNQWQRVEGTYTPLVGITSLSIRGNADAFVGTIAIWGFQIEQGSYSTSYIPTTTTAVTRVADACFKTGISSLIGQTQGTIFFDLSSVTGTVTGTGNPDIAFRNTASSNWMGVTTNTFSNPFRFTFRSATTLIDYQANITRAKVACSYGAFGVKLFVNGSLVASSVTIPTTTFDILDLKGGIIKSEITTVMSFLLPKSDAELIALTTI